MLVTKSPKNSNQVDLSRSRFYELRLESGERDRKRNTLAFNDTWFEKGEKERGIERKRVNEGEEVREREREIENIIILSRFLLLLSVH